MRIIVNGALGKMGRLACETIEQQSQFKLVGKLTKSDDLKKQIEELRPDIVVDLTRADVVYRNASIIIETHCHPVIGTSGLTNEQIEKLSQSCAEKKLGGLIVPNFSLAAMLMMNFSKQAARYLSQVEVIEIHHQHKVDAPSGTALKTAQMIKEANPNKLSDVPIHSLRLPGFLAQQQVIFGSEGESLTITHNSIDRRCFMPGLIMACEQVSSLTTLVYGLEQILFSKGFETSTMHPFDPS